jgi:large subunit ribosomal protein L21
MYAIIADSGRQERVEEGQELRVDYREVEAGATIVFDRVLALRDASGLQIGAPVLAGLTVTAEVIDTETKGPKLTVQKFRKRKNSRRRTGHRQTYTTVKITKIG